MDYFDYKIMKSMILCCLRALYYDIVLMRMMLTFMLLLLMMTIRVYIYKLGMVAQW